MSFYKMKIDAELFNEALERAANLPEFKLNFKQKLEANDGELQSKIAGTIGEIVVERWLKGNGIEYRDDRQVHTHDYVLTKGNLTTEIKTKLRRVAPTLNYECTVPKYTANMQTARLYIFVSLTEIKDKEICNEKYPVAYIKGAIAKKRFNEQSRLFHIGDRDPLNGFVCKEDCYNVYARDLTPPSNFPSRYAEYCDSLLTTR